jgi:hypothetical protein
MRRLFRSVCLALFVCLPSGEVFAQARDGKISVTVADQTGAVIPNATVTVVGLEDATKKTPVAPARTSDKGIATFEGLVIGRYSIQAEFPGFDLGLLRDIRIKSGDNKHVVVLPLKKMETEVTVGPDKQAAATDRNATFGTALTRDQVAALSDNPDELKQQLLDMAGPDAVFRVDSFEGADLPPKAQIKSIHITRDTFAAENHTGGGLFIDIITQPGQGPIRVNTNYNLSGSKLSGKDLFTGLKTPSENQFFGGNLGGTLIKDKSSFSLNVNGSTSFQTPLGVVALPTGTQLTALDVRTRNDFMGVNGLLDYAITRDQTLRMSFNSNTSTSSNLGIGAYDLAGRAYSSHSDQYSLRVQEAGPLGRRFFTNTRLQVAVRDSSSQSATEAQTIQVADAFTSGGAQKKGGTRAHTFNFASDLDYVRGINSWRAGVQLDGTFYHSDAISNYLGTYTFTNLANYEAGLPATFTKTIGNPVVDYFNLNSGIYLQDDIRVRKNLTLSPGLRYEVQTHLSDYHALSPRFGATWSPFKSGHTSLQASAGIFHDWLSTAAYQQTLQYDGTHLQSLDVFDPSYPDPGAAGTISPSDTYLLGPNLRMQDIRRITAGFNQQITARLRVNTNYSYQRVSHILSGVNLNAPVNGVRPNPGFVNLYETLSNANSLAHQIQTNVGISFAAPSPALNQARFNWKRTSVNATYIWRHSRNDSSGAFGISPSGTLATEWGPDGSDIHHRVIVGINTQAIKNMNANISVNASTGSPYNETTGVDNNGDLIFNDRPAGVSRNSLRAPEQWGVNANFSYNIGFGKKGSAGGGMGMPGGGQVMIMNGGGVAASDIAKMVAAAAQNVPPRYNLFISLNASNLTNHENLTGYSGNMLSPFFMRPTAAGGPRRVSVSMGFSF